MLPPATHTDCRPGPLTVVYAAQAVRHANIHRPRAYSRDRLAPMANSLTLDRDPCTVRTSTSYQHLTAHRRSWNIVQIANASAAATPIWRNKGFSFFIVLLLIQTRARRRSLRKPHSIHAAVRRRRRREARTSRSPVRGCMARRRGDGNHQAAAPKDARGALRGLQCAPCANSDDHVGSSGAGCRGAHAPRV